MLVDSSLGVHGVTAPRDSLGELSLRRQNNFILDLCLCSFISRVHLLPDTADTKNPNTYRSHTFDKSAQLCITPVFERIALPVLMSLF
jgi:hypothetical protein